MLVKTELQHVDNILQSATQSDIELITRINSHILSGKGKRLRTFITLLVGKAIGNPDIQELCELAASIELIHNATLLHDDVVDFSSKRRFKPTANKLWGNAKSILSGDFLYSQAFKVLAKRNNIEVLKALANATSRISEGEMLQLQNNKNLSLNVHEYFKIIERKTAELYSAAAMTAAIIATNDSGFS